MRTAVMFEEGHWNCLFAIDTAFMSSQEFYDDSDGESCAPSTFSGVVKLQTVVQLLSYVVIKH